MERNKLETFKQDLKNLISKERLQSCNGIERHFENLYVIAEITPKIASIEIALRNILDFCMIETKQDKDWIINSSDKSFIEIREKINEREGNKHLLHHQYISRLTLGNIIQIIKDNGLQDDILNSRKINFRNYSQSNRNYFFKENKKTTFNNTETIDIILNLLPIIRNRAYHWENLLKTRQKPNNKTNEINIFPRLTTKKQDTFIGIDPNNITRFLDDVLECINKNLKCYTNIEIEKK